jgi:hypothetical protein
MRIPLLLATLAACSSNHPTTTITADAPAVPVDAGPAPVTYTATMLGSGVAGVVVYFQSADSTLLTTAMTDSTGTATGSVGSGGFVTAIETDVASEPNSIATWTDVLPGDHIAVAEFKYATSNLPVSVPTLTGAVQYAISTSCGSGLFTATDPTVVLAMLDVAAPCAGPHDVEVVALDAEYNALGSIYAPSQTLDGSLDLTAQTYAAPGPTRSYTWTDPADGASKFSESDLLVTDAGTVYESPEITPVASGESLTATRTLASSTALDVVLSDAMIGGTAVGFYEWGQGTGPYVTDWAQHTMSELGNLDYDATSHTLTFVLDNSVAVKPNGFEATIEATRPSDGRQWFWVVESAQQAIQLPILPTTIYDWNIAATDIVQTSEAATYNVPFDPTEIRENQGTYGLVDRVTGGAGAISYASYFPPVVTGDDARRSRTRQLRLPFHRR